MKRKISNIEDEENRLSKLLFNKPAHFAPKVQNDISLHCDDELRPVWVDEDDEKDWNKSTSNTAQYSAVLKQKFTTLVGTPNWAKLNKKIKKESDDEDNEPILKTVGHLQKVKLSNLKKDLLEIKKLPKLNTINLNQGILQSIEFHPKASVILLGGRKGSVSLFSIEGSAYNKLHSFALQRFSVSSCHFLPNGTEAYMSSYMGRDYCIYDLEHATPRLMNIPSDIKQAKIFVMSPNGKYLAIADGLDEIYFICAKSKELLRIFKNNSRVQAATFTSNSDMLYCFNEGGEVTVWDLSTYRIQKKFFDNGCVSPSCIKTSNCGRYLATGSGEGIVNVYETANLDSADPFPSHVIQNLQTKITEIKFNNTSEILGIASSVYPNALKLVHIPSYHVFQNFPYQNSGFSKITCMSFSPNSGYMALGNEKTALLYRLKHFKNY